MSDVVAEGTERPARVAVVVIGRNEANVLARSLRSAAEHPPAVVYVDSASSDGSADVAESLGIACVRLDAGPIMSAARGRNAGREHVRQRVPTARYIQFVDGDTELAPGWVERAADYLDQHSDIAVVAGRLRERFRQRNAYHRLADMEFDTATGERDAVGGIAMYRVAAFDAVGGFNPRLTTGEEYDICMRIRARGMRVFSLPDTMAFHDIQMDAFSEWLRRTTRTGYSAAQHLAERGTLAKQVASMLAWGGALPAVALGLAVPTLGVSLGVLGAYAVLWERVRQDALRRGMSLDDAALCATGNVLGKVPEAYGVLEYARRYVRGRVRRGGA